MKQNDTGIRWSNRDEKEPKRETEEEKKKAAACLTDYCIMGETASDIPWSPPSLWQNFPQDSAAGWKLSANQVQPGSYNLIMRIQYWHNTPERERGGREEGRKRESNP